MDPLDTDLTFTRTGHTTDGTRSTSHSTWLTPRLRAVGVHLCASGAEVARGLWHDWVLRSAIILAVFLISYQLVVTVLRPPWLVPVTDWLLTILSWLVVAVVVLVSLRLSRARRPGVPSRWFLSAGLISYAVARTIWTVDDYLILHHDLPFPSFLEFLFALQYPCFFLAILLLPRTTLAGSRLITFLDSLLFLGAAAALSWYFLLAPLFSQSRLSPLARAVSLAYPLGDLLVLVSLTLVLVRPSYFHTHRPALRILFVAAICMILGDSLAAMLVLHPQHVFRRGDLPELFWIASRLLITLAALVSLRWPQPIPIAPAIERAPLQIQWDAFVASLRVFAPFVAALLASATILVRAIVTMEDTGPQGLVASLAVSMGLLLLVIVRQEVIFLEHARLQHEQEAARAHTQALQELNRRKDAYLSIVSHELKTPLTSLRGYLELLARRLRVWRPNEQRAEDRVRSVAMTRTAATGAEESVGRITRLVDDLLDDTQIRDDQFALHFAHCDLAEVVCTAVEEQRTLAPQRTIRLDLPATQRVVVFADAMRIGQAVTNYLTNALKYSQEEWPVTARLEVEGAGDGAGEGAGAEGVARVSVRDEGIGVPDGAEEFVWERFQQIEGNVVQSGAGIGLGIGLYITKHIVEGHRGQVGVHSTAGQGSTFWFTLPLAPILQDAQNDQDSQTAELC